MKRLSFGSVVLVLASILLASCSKQEEAGEAARFDARYIAAEADKGNLVPLKELNEACSAESKKFKERAASCETQDRVGALRKPFRLNF